MPDRDNTARRQETPAIEQDSTQQPVKLAEAYISKIFMPGMPDLVNFKQDYDKDTILKFKSQVQEFAENLIKMGYDTGHDIKEAWKTLTREGVKKV